MSKYPIVVRPATGPIFVRMHKPWRRAEIEVRSAVGRNVVLTDHEDGWKSLSRSHLRPLLFGLTDRYFAVELTLHGSGRNRCVEACWGAKSEADWMNCECVCLGLWHGCGEAPYGWAPGGSADGGNVVLGPEETVTRTVWISQRTASEFYGTDPRVHGPGISGSKIRSILNREVSERNSPRNMDAPYIERPALPAALRTV